METTYLLNENYSWFNSFIFLIKFRIRQKIRSLFTKKRDASKFTQMERHNVRVVRQVGRRLLVECTQCYEQAIVLDKIEAKGVFSRIECLSKGGDNTWMK